MTVHQIPNTLDLQAFWMPFTANRQFKETPRLFASAEGMYYTSVDGRKVIDASAGLWCVNAGHGRKQIAQAVERQLMNLDPYGGHARAIGEELFKILGRIARCDPAKLPLRDCLKAPTPEDCWRAALDEWQAVIERDERHPQPIVRAAMRRLRRNVPPPPAKLSVVHGDYRSGNFMHDGRGTILGVLDWEMVHFGDAVEDLAWCFDPLWNHFDESRVAATISEAEAIAIWERESGLSVDPAALKWWKLFSAVKGCAIWTTSGKEFCEGSHDLVLGFAGTYTARRHDCIMADLLERLVEEGWS